MSPAASEADRLIAALDLAPHPEGGWFRETYRGAASADGRATSTAILFLLKAGELSRWHRIDAAEIWHWHRGAPLELTIALEGGERQVLRLGPDIEAGETPQGIVPPGAWQTTRPLGDYGLIGCTVAPGFDFARFELAAEGWEP
jgi:predicted cupin superfamily sugar epimerase